MIKTEAFGEFRQALTRLRDDDPDKALAHVQRALELESHNPFYLSYFGMLQARVERKWAKGEELCETAVRMRREEPQLYLNLADVYAVAGRREDAIEALNRGIKNARRDPRLQSALNKLAIRRPPVLPFLARQHFLNRNLGKLRHRALKYFGKA